MCSIISGLEIEIKTPFARLVAKRWLHGQTEKYVFKLLIDTIRVRSWDEQDLAAQMLMDIVQDSCNENVTCPISQGGWLQRIAARWVVLGEGEGMCQLCS